MILRFKRLSDFLVVVGMKGKGKTTLTKFYVKNACPEFIAIDPTWQLGTLGYVVHYPERLQAAFQYWKKVVYQPSHMTKEKYTEVFRLCLDLTNYTLVVDEIDKFARPRWYICEELREIINRGRAQGIGLIGNTRRPHLIHNDIRGNANHVICFKLQERRERDYMAEWMGVESEAIKNLPNYESIYYNVESGTSTRQRPLY